MADYLLACRFYSLCTSCSRTFSLSILLSRRSHYDILGVSRNATLREIKEAYFQKSKVCHPDNQGNTREFLELKTAYDILRRPADRKNYDNFLAGINTYNHYGRNPSRDYKGKNWNNFWNETFDQPFRASAKAHRDREVQSWRNIFYFTLVGFTVIMLYNMYIWYGTVRQEKRIGQMIARDEIAKCFLRQREYKDRLDDQMQIEFFAQLLGDNIEQAQKMRNEELMRVPNTREIREEYRWMEAVNAPQTSKQYKQLGE